MSTTTRALHFVFKVADRTSTIDFYRNVLAMKVRLRKFSNACMIIIIMVTVIIIIIIVPKGATS